MGTRVSFVTLLVHGLEDFMQELLGGPSSSGNPSVENVSFSSLTNAVQEGGLWL